MKNVIESPISRGTVGVINYFIINSWKKNELVNNGEKSFNDHKTVLKRYAEHLFSCK